MARGLLRFPKSTGGGIKAVSSIRKTAINKTAETTGQRSNPIPDRAFAQVPAVSGLTGLRRWPML
jgi:hypothetical protein